MAFSFNWAGLQAPKVDIPQMHDLNTAGKAFGLAARGYKDRVAAEDYADMIDAYNTGRRERTSARAAEIRSEIARLEEQNRQLMQMMAPQQVEVPAEQPSLALVDPSQASVEFQQQYQQLEQNPLFPYVQTAQPQFPIR